MKFYTKVHIFIKNGSTAIIKAVSHNYFVKSYGKQQNNR